MLIFDLCSQVHLVDKDFYCCFVVQSELFYSIASPCVIAQMWLLGQGMFEHCWEIGIGIKVSNVL